MSPQAMKRAIIEQALRPWAHAVGADLMGEAQREAPVEEGTLRGSARYDVKETIDGVEVEVSFNTVYAARQHEEVEYKHPKGGKAKYLSDPLKANAQRYSNLLAAFVRRVT
jgi:hypothetical protein